jgi:hypothetical protein
MGGPKEGTKTTMEMDSIVVKMSTKGTQVAPHPIEATTKIMHPSTLVTIVEIDEVTKNLQ